MMVICRTFNGAAEHANWMLVSVFQPTIDDERQVVEGLARPLLNIRRVDGHQASSPAAVATSCSASHASTLDFFQTRRRPSLNEAGPWPMLAQ
jgi:hypothetical protein